jgi:serine/threonine-protein kinase
LPPLLRGEAKPRDAAEGILLAQFCQRYRKHYAAAARLYADAFAAEPKRAEDLQQANRYNAACAAALAGCGKGEDAAKLGTDERARLRRQALAWLRADLAVRARFLDGDPKQASAVVGRALKHWRTDLDLAGVRGQDALASLPEADRAAWRQLWADVDGLLNRDRPEPEFLPPPKPEPE